MEERRTENLQMNVVRKVLQNEISWLLMFGGVTLSIIKYIVLPINEMQVVLAQVHSDIARLQTQRETSDILINDLTSRLTKVETILEQLHRRP